MPSKLTVQIFIFVIFVLTGCTSTTGVDDISIPVPTNDPATSPIPIHNWPEPVLVSEFTLTPSDLGRISVNFDIDLGSGTNTLYEVDDSEVQLNEIFPSNSPDLVPLFHSLFSQVGDINSVVLGYDSVYEIISENPYAAEAVRHSLDVSQIQALKLTPHQAYGEFRIIRDEVISSVYLDKVSTGLGFNIAELINQEISLDNVTWKVNFFLPDKNISPLDARDKLIEWKNSDIGVYALNGVVIEIVTDQPEIAENIWRVINVPPPPRSDIYRYRVRFSAIPLERADYMIINSLFNKLLDGAVPSSLASFDPNLAFGDSFPLFLCDGRTILDSNPEITLDQVDNSISIGSIVIPEANLGEPIEVEFDLTVETNRAYEKGPEDIIKYVNSTPFWPVNSDLAKNVLADARAEATSDTTVGLIKGLNSWVGDNIEYSGDILGSRYGVETVLEQRYGRCWDLSDVFVTISRTAGLPTRQVAGWVYGLGGHVWAQVWLEEQHAWVDVDPTRDHVGVTALYIPIWGTIDGEMLFLYSEMPEIERLGF